MRTLPFLIFASVLLSSCGKEGPLAFEVKDLDQVTGEEVDFQTVRKAVLSKCIGCHAQYGDYEAVRKDLDQIVASVSANRMPKNSPPLAQNLKTLLTDWARAGAPEGNSPGSAETELNFKKITREILGPKCVQCHNPNGQARFLDLSTRQALWEAREKLLNFEDPTRSYLIAVITDPEEPMPPVWASLGRLTEEEIETLKEWIGKGIP